MRHPGFAELVGFEVFPESDGTGKGQLTVSECHLNPNGVVHGGAYSPWWTQQWVPH